MWKLTPSPGIISHYFSHRSQGQPGHLPQSQRAADHEKPRLDVTELVPTVHKLFTAGLAPATQKVYHAGPSWHQNNDCYYLHQQKLASDTVKSYLAAAQHAQISRGLGNPQIQGMPQLEYVLKGVEKVIKEVPANYPRDPGKGQEAAP